MLISLIKLYRFIISPFLGGACRFHPTCSAYAIGAIQKHGNFHGSFLTLKRLLKCHPWHHGEFHDPVP